MTNCGSAFSLLLAFMPPALAQDVPLPPKPVDDGPSIEFTMKYIEDKLNTQAKARFTTVSTSREGDEGEGHDHVFRRMATSELSAAKAELPSCKFSFRIRATESVDGESLSTDRRFDFSLKDVSKITIRGGNDGDGPLVSNQYYPDPPYFQLNIIMISGKVARSRDLIVDPDGKRNEGSAEHKEIPLRFQDEDAAQRTAKAMVHAVELCGGGDKDPFKL